MRMSGEKLPKPYYGDGRLGEIVLKACAHDPHHRYSSAMQMRQELEAILYDINDADLIYPSGDEMHLQKNVYASQTPASRNTDSEDATRPQAPGEKPSAPKREAALSAEETTADATIRAPKQASKKKKSILPVLLLIVLLAAAGGFLFFRNQKAGQEKLRNYESCMAQAQQYRASDPDTALSLYENAQQLYPDQEAPYIAYAYTLYESRRYEDCIRYIESDLSLGKHYSDEGQSQLSEILGAAYFEIEDYAAAASFFRLSVMNDSVTVSAMRDYAVCLGKLGDLQAASAIMDRMTQAGASGAVMAYVQAEIDYDTGNYHLAEEGFSVALQTAGDSALQRRAIRSLAELYRTCADLERQGQHTLENPNEKEIQVLSNGIHNLHMESDSTLVEMLAMAHYEQAALCQDAEAAGHLEESARYFAMVLDMGIAKDYLFRNLYTISYELKDYDAAASYLAEYETAFPGDYMPHALRAILLITQENEKPRNQRDYSAALAEYEIAGKLLRSADDQTYYQQIQGLIQQLEEKNWL